MTGRIEPQPWMTEPATQRVMRALAEGGAGARFVGGCVRDALLGRPIRDIDIATDGSPERVTAILAAAGIKVVPTGFAHGTVTAVVDHRGFEITTLRVDVETFGRHARVAFTDDWVADAARRDFTFNAMSLETDGTLHDPFGGEADLRARRVRFVGAARQRIEEDVLRLLRYFRFHAHYGAPPPDAEALDACRAMAPRLPDLSAERVAAELMKLLAAPDPVPVLRLMRAEGVLARVLDEARDLARLARMVRIDAAADPLRRLAALLPSDPAGALAVAQ
ncbi:MAG: CCA tRNA nucleotidyltransferase, partial [Alphaproteobacteria bacterium]